MSRKRTLDQDYRRVMEEARIQGDQMRTVLSPSGLARTSREALRPSNTQAGTALSGVNGTPAAMQY